MLRNKFFIGFLALLLVAVGVYNWRYFSQRNITTKKTIHKPSSPIQEIIPELSLPLGKERLEKDSITRPREISAKIKGEWKNLLEQEHWGRNPFLTPSEAGYYSHITASYPGTEKGERADTINAILTGEAGKVAVINHIVVAEGDWIGGEQVAEIRPDSVLLQRGEEQRVIVIEESPVAITVE